MNIATITDGKNKNYDNIKVREKNKVIMTEKVVTSQLAEKFELLNFLQKGKNSYFYQGKTKKEPKKKIGIKFLLNDDLIPKRRKNHEFLLHNKLKHKNIINVYDHFKINQNSCIIMELGKYGDLEHFQRIFQNRLSETFLCYFASQVLEGILYIHECNVIHMDIQPKNIIVNECFDMKITDFSNSIDYKNKEPNELIEIPLKGTSYYMSPEVLRNEGIMAKDASKIDMWSLGVTLFLLAFGDYPYKLGIDEPSDYKSILENIEKNKLIIPSEGGLSDSFLEFLKKLLEKDIKKRMKFDEALEHPWIKGSSIIFDEKEKLVDNDRFLRDILLDRINSFNDYLDYWSKK